LVRDARTPTSGDIAVVANEDEQRQGIGSALIRQLVEIANVIGITTLGSDMLAENNGARRLIRRLGLPHTTTTRYGETQVTIQLLGDPQLAPHPAEAESITPYARAV